MLMWLLTPLLLLRLLIRSRRMPAYRKRWNERLGLYRGKPQKNAIWFHTVSVGEAEAAFPLIQAVQAQFPDQPFLVTTTTPTGSARVKVFLGDSVQHVYIPFDTPGAVQRFYRHFQPALSIIMETEIWPNLLHYAKTVGVPVVLVNARLSAKSAAGYAKMAGLTREALGHITTLCAQGKATADRFEALGMNPERIQISGNIKFDLSIPDDLMPQAAEIHRDWFGGRPVWIAASTHDGEEESVLTSFSRLLKEVPDALLLLVPRHPERAEGIVALCGRQGYRVVRRSSGETDCRAADVFLLDTIGELRLFYATADVAFVGGSLVPTGGHNMLEPAALGVPVIFGPHVFNFPEISQLLLEAHAAKQVADDQSLTAVLLDLMTHAEARRDLAERGREFVDQNRGALQRVQDAITQAWTQQVQARR